MTGAVLEAFHLPGTRGRLFCVVHRPKPDTPLRGGVLYLAPFAEEMNKSRRMAALQARSLARAGWLVLQPDMFGCGDSDGEFGDATWQTWLDDAVAAAGWLSRTCGSAPLLWGLRAGCLLAVAASRASPGIARLILWQPVLSGRQHLQQFLRLKLAGGMLDEERAKAGGTKQMLSELRAGEAVEVAGYALSSALALGLENATLDPAPGSGELVWLEVSGATVPEVGLAARQSQAAWTAAGWRVDSRVLPGPAFWQTQEIELVPDLVAATTDAVARMAS